METFTGHAPIEVPTEPIKASFNFHDLSHQHNGEPVTGIYISRGDYSTIARAGQRVFKFELPNLGSDIIRKVEFYRGGDRFGLGKVTIDPDTLKEGYRANLHAKHTLATLTHPLVPEAISNGLEGIEVDLDPSQIARWKRIFEAYMAFSTSIDQELS